MSYYKEDAYANCPFYHREKGRVLTCEGVPEKSASCSTHFVDGVELARYKSKYCRKNYEECELYKALMTKYD